MKFLLDTNICIAAMRGHPSVRENLGRHTPHEIGLSMVTWFELWTGIHLCANPDRERRKVQVFVEPLHLLSFDDPSARAAAGIRARLQKTGELIGPYDLLIAGHALAMDVALVTGNTHEFRRVDGLRVVDWSR